MAAIALTVLAGFAGGFALRRLGVPAGGLIGSFGAVALLSVASGIAFLPAETRVAVQIVAGAFVGCSIGKDELKTAKAVAKPAAFMLAWYAVFVLAVGFAIWALTPLSLPTALMSCVPGGISDIPIVAASMGANTPDVTLLQLLRLLLGIALMAAVAQMVTRKTRRPVRGAAKIDPRAPGALATPLPSQPSGRVPEIGPEASRIDMPDRSLSARTKLKLALKGLATLAVAAVAGLAGRATGIPGMTFTFAIGCTLAFNLATGFSFVPRWLKRLCQYLAGAYLGAQMTLGDVAALPELLAPALIILTAYAASFLALGYLQHRLFGYTLEEGLFIATPAGASDIALVMDDLGMRNANVTIMQILRLICVLALFPQMVNIVLLLAGS